MRKLTSRLMLTALAAVALAACVTINVYFPAAEIKDLSQQIEQEVQKQAAREAAKGQAAETPAPAPSPAPAPVPEPGDDPGRQAPGQTSSLFDLLVGATPAYAQAESVAQPEVTSPAIRRIIESRAARVADLARFKSQGAIGENNRALVEIRKLEAVADLKARAEVQRLVKAENADREELFKEMAVAKGVDLSQLPKIRETYAGTLRDNARPGDWIRLPDGTWKQK